MDKIYIYGLVDPRTAALRYVGVTSYNIDHRYRQHLSNARCGVRFPVYNWIRKLGRLNRLPLLVLIEEASNRERERFWIGHFRAAGLSLLNLTEGGEGVTGPNRPEVVEKKRLNLIHVRLRNHEKRIAGTFQYNHGNHPKGSDWWNAKLDETAVISIRQRNHSGVSTSLLACEYGVTNGAIRRIVRGLCWRHVDAGVPLAPEPRCGTKPRSSKLTWGQVREIRTLYASGQWTLISLAKRYGVGQTTISSVVRRLSWTHIE